MKFEHVDDDTYARHAVKVFKERYKVSEDSLQSDIDSEDMPKFNL
jgi:hypothetical protein